jgi:DNA-binding FrmR family transcriptional regulator
MSHTIKAKAKLLNRARRIRGQAEALERALAGERECGEVLRLIAAARGAMDSLMAEVLEGTSVSTRSPGVAARATRSQQRTISSRSFVPI